MTYFYIDTHLLKNSQNQPEEFDAFQKVWEVEMGQAFVVSSVSFVQNRDGTREDTFTEVPYPLTEVEATRILASFEKSEFKHLTKYIEKCEYVLDDFLGQKQEGYIAGSAKSTLEDLRNGE